MKKLSLGKKQKTRFASGKFDNKKSGYEKLILFIVFLLVVIGAIAFYFLKYKKNFSYISNASHTTLQTFDNFDCQKMETCKLGDLNCDSNGSTIELKDERDGKIYHVRKFEDENCWMIDNLAYGGGFDGSSDYCLDKTDLSDPNYWRSANSNETIKATASNGLNSNSLLVYSGNCVNPAIENNYCTWDGNNCGYLYNWAAATQNENAYVGGNMNTVEEPLQGICPNGWALPLAEGNGSFLNLHQRIGYNWNSQTMKGDGQFGFWQTSSQWNGAFSGLVFIDESFQAFYSGPENDGSYWTSSEKNSKEAYSAIFSTDKALLKVSSNKNQGLAIRCVLINNKEG